MKTILSILVLTAALSALATEPPVGTPVVAGPAVVAIHGMGQVSPTRTISARTNVVGGITNVTAVYKDTTTNFTINADALMAALTNSFQTNFPAGSRLLLENNGNLFEFIVSDSTGTNFGFDPGPVLSSSFAGNPGYTLNSGVVSETLTNNALVSGKELETTATAIKFTYDDSGMTPADGKHTVFTWTGLAHNKFSQNLSNGLYNANVTIDVSGTGEYRGGIAVVTGTISAHVTGLLGD